MVSVNTMTSGITDRERYDRSSLLNVRSPEMCRPYKELNISSLMRKICFIIGFPFETS